jgi:hypothetical protein
MGYPESWIRETVETATGRPAHPMAAPESAALPYVVFGRTATEREYSLGGTKTYPSGTFSLEIYGLGYATVKQLADQVRIALHQFNRAGPGVTISSSILTDERDGEPIFFDGQAIGTYLVEQTYKIRWEE